MSADGETMISRKPIDIKVEGQDGASGRGGGGGGRMMGRRKGQGRGEGRGGGMQRGGGGGGGRGGGFNNSFGGGGGGGGQRGGFNQGPHRGGVGGRRRGPPFQQDHNMMDMDSMDDGGYPGGKRLRLQGPEGRIYDRLRQLYGQTTIDLPPRKCEEPKKFLANTRIYIGNIANEVTEQELKEMFEAFGETEEIFINREKNFAFLKLDYRLSAEKARAELDQKQIKGRPIKVRFSPATVRLKVKNLNPVVSNELLEYAFSIFGDIEKATVIVDEKGKSTGEGFIDYTRKNFAQQAHKFCTEKCYFITTDIRPVVTEYDVAMPEYDEGLPEMNLNKKEFNKETGETVYYKHREIGPRIAEPDSFEENYGQKWKDLIKTFAEREEALRQEKKKEFDKLVNQIEIARYDYETEVLRQQLKQREIDQERIRNEWQTRGGNQQQMQQQFPNPMHGGAGGGGGYGGFNKQQGMGSEMDQMMMNDDMLDQTNIIDDQGQGLPVDQQKIQPLIPPPSFQMNDQQDDSQWQTSFSGNSGYVEFGNGQPQQQQFTLGGQGHLQDSPSQYTTHNYNRTGGGGGRGGGGRGGFGGRRGGGEGFNNRSGFIKR